MKHIISYLFCVVLAISFMFLLNGRLGIFLAAIMLLAFLLSFIMISLVKNKITLTAAAKTEQVNKGDNIELDFSISKSTWLPTPLVEVRFTSTGNVEAMSPECFRIALDFTKDPRSYKIMYKAMYSGLAEIKIMSVKIIDYLGLFRYDITKKFNIEAFGGKFGVLPIIHEISGQNELLKICCDASAYDDDAQESDEASMTSSGVAGYEHREYAIGDPIKRINWKLSSKRDSLMIRLDEKLATASQALIFDCSDIHTDSENYFRIYDRVAEAALAMLALMLRQGQSCEVYVCTSGVWEKLEIEDESDMLDFQSILADYIPYDNNLGLPYSMLKESSNSVAMCFTSDYGEALAQKTTAVKSCGCELYYVIPQENVKLFTLDNGYAVSDDFDFTNLQR